MAPRTGRAWTVTQMTGGEKKDLGTHARDGGGGERIRCGYLCRTWRNAMIRLEKDMAPETSTMAESSTRACQRIVSVHWKRKKTQMTRETRKMIRSAMTADYVSSSRADTVQHDDRH